MDVKQFKKGIQKIEIKKLKEVGKSAAQVEFAVNIDVKLSKDYRGPLKNGKNQMYFLVRPKEDWEFKNCQYRHSSTTKSKIVLH
ncbi:hypothetical protein BIV60_25340 [Bacillus sp. MUM 116]|nr:hypothetical protein BIV60_25340 [Bacillus sp. MUM 116]